MKKVITYGTYDLLHQGHINLLRRAKELGDYLIVGVTADGFDQERGKINVQQSLVERIEAVKSTGYADMVIVEEYEGQKIDDIKRYDVDVFTVGSDWVGKFDYLNEYCEVKYLDRTEGISSSDIRSRQRQLRLGMIGSIDYLEKFERESHFVNGLEVMAICTDPINNLPTSLSRLSCVTNNYKEMLENVDAVFIMSAAQEHYQQIKDALLHDKHVICESPIVLRVELLRELQTLAKEHGCILMDSLRTAYSTAYNRLLLLVKSGVIGKICSVDATCTSLRKVNPNEYKTAWNSMGSWGPTAMLPVFQILGCKYKDATIYSHIVNHLTMYDAFTKIAFAYKDAVASIKVGKGVKSEGELIISGTEGYVYVPAPWWKTDYFEVRRENPSMNKRYFYQLDGEGIRYELVTFLKLIQTGKSLSYIDSSVTEAIIGLFEKFYKGEFVKI